MNVVILIPSLNPDDMLPQVVEAIRREGFSRFLIVNDGSDACCLPVFDRLEAEGCAVVHHAVNLGKGRALKTGFNHAMKYMGDAAGVVTCDADGQHEPAAIRAVAQAMLDHPDRIVMGARKFFEARVPTVNLIGNTLTRLAFVLLTGLAFGDTQSGLRAFPMRVLPRMMKVAGERFEFENVMLLSFRENGQDYMELPMRAAYETVDHGRKSHFDKFADSVRIYKKLLGFAAVPIFCGLLASVIFMLCAPALTAASVLPAAAASILAGLLALWLLSPARPGRSAFMTVAITALGTGLMWLFAVLCALPPVGAWWLMGAACGPAAYSLWLLTRFGKRPKRYKLR